MAVGHRGIGFFCWLVDWFLVEAVRGSWIAYRGSQIAVLVLSSWEEMVGEQVVREEIMEKK